MRVDGQVLVVSDGLTTCDCCLQCGCLTDGYTVQFQSFETLIGRAGIEKERNISRYAHLVVCLVGHLSVLRINGCQLINLRTFSVGVFNLCSCDVERQAYSRVLVGIELAVEGGFLHDESLVGLNTERVTTGVERS